MKTIETGFDETGIRVLRGVLTEAEVDRLAGPIRAAFASGDYDGFSEESAYPSPGVYSMGPRILQEHPEIADVSLAHPAIVAAVEELFGEPATLAQYWSIMRPPGAGVGEEPFVNGSGAHFDYKPWRCVGSFVKWTFAVIPFVDYTETAGPLVVSPGSYLKTKVLPSDGRVHQVDVAQVPTPAEVGFLQDPVAKKGDVILMHGFTWHEARPNYGDTDRCGLYMKFHAKSSPPACGPTIYPSPVHDHLPAELKHLVPYHRGDGKYAAVRDRPMSPVDEARLLIEDGEGRVLVLRNGEDGWALPRFAAEEDESAGILDACNVMGSVVARAREQLGLRLPWLSWLIDLPGSAAEGTGEWRCRVYGHRLLGAGPELIGEGGDRPEHRWMSGAELDEAESAGQLECEGAERRWLRMWQEEEDEEGLAVTRSFGLPSTDVKDYNYNGGGNPQGHYRIGVFDSEGRRTPPPPPKLEAR